MDHNVKFGSFTEKDYSTFLSRLPIFHRMDEDIGFYCFFVLLACLHVGKAQFNFLN